MQAALKGRWAAAAAAAAASANETRGQCPERLVKFSSWPLSSLFFIFFLIFFSKPPKLPNIGIALLVEHMSGH